MLYDPGEDSYLLEKHIKDNIGPLVLDMGTGTGIQGLSAARWAERVVAADIDPEAIKSAKLQAELDRVKNIEFIESDLFSAIPKQRFDLILFNPPYLPEEGLDDVALFSGKRGCDTTIRFLDRVNDFLKPDGKILLITSSLASQQKISEAISANLLESEILNMQHIFFEDIILLRLRKSGLGKALEHRGYSRLRIFAHGRRGIIVKGSYKGKTVAVKSKKPGSMSPGTIMNEARILSLVNSRGIGPKLVESADTFLSYEFVNGVFIEEFLLSADRDAALSVLEEVLRQCFVLDCMGISKFEMHRPVKHILVDGKEVTLLDFERARNTLHPKNVTQFTDYLLSRSDLLKKKGIRIDEKSIIAAAKTYRKGQGKEGFRFLCRQVLGRTGNA